MTGVSHLSSLYAAAPIILWVEDSLTRDYLRQLWGDPADISFLIAGSSAAVRSAVASARREGIRHVFGFVDRDFGKTNVEIWAEPTTSVLCPSAHETENYLLDVEAIVNCALNNRSRTVEQVQSELGQLASRQPSWLACRQILKRMQADLGSEFPDHPKLDRISSTAEALTYIKQAKWLGEIQTRIGKWTDNATLDAALQQSEQEYQDSLKGDHWTMEFSGKEIFRPLRSFVYQPKTREKGINHDNDFAKAIGAWQQLNSRAPKDLNLLLKTLRDRI